MSGKKGLVLGVANEFSIAWAVSKQLIKEGAEIVFASHHRMSEKFVEPLVRVHAPGSQVIPCDVQDRGDLENMCRSVENNVGGLDFFVHSIAFASRDCFSDRYLETKREDFVESMLISCFSFTECCHLLEPLMKEGGACLTMTYLGSNRLVNNYKVMGVSKAALESSVRYIAADLGASKKIRVNALSPGPLRTLAASGIKGFGDMHSKAASFTLLGRNVTTDEAGKAALYLLSDLASGVTGEIHYVDAGAHGVAVPSGFGGEHAS